MPAAESPLPTSASGMGTPTHAGLPAGLVAYVYLLPSGVG